jgi:hypothetical protein
MLDAKAVPAGAYVAYGAEHCSKTSGNVAEGLCQKIRPRQVRECEAVHTC